MIAVVRTAIITWVVLWSTSRLDVTLHLVGWVIFGSALAAYARATWLTSFPFLINFAEDASSEMLEILPDSKPLLILFSFTMGSFASLFLAGAERKSRGHAMRGAWLFFALSRVLFPLSFCGVDFNQDRSEALLVGLFSILGLVGPLSSWPSRAYTISDIVYALIVQRGIGGGDICSGTESAVVATFLALAHDVVHMRFLHFLEATAFAVATVFIFETTILVGFHRLSPRDESWSDALNFTEDIESYLLTKAPPVLLTAWAVGMLFRTLTQGRLSLVEVFGCVGFSAVLGGIVLYFSKNPKVLASRPSFACACAVVAMGAASRLASGRKRVLKLNQYILASGFFPREVSAFDDGDLVDDSTFGVLSMLPESRSESVSDFTKSIEEELQQNVIAYTPRNVSNLERQLSAKTVPVLPLPPTAEALENQLEKAIHELKALEKHIFRKEASLKGHHSATEKEALKEEIAQLKRDETAARETIANLTKKLDDLSGTQQQ